MIPQTQRWFRGAVFDADGKQTDEGGDCFAACVASILEVSIEGFPNFLAGEEGVWYDRWQRWLYEKYRVELLYWQDRSEWPDPETQLSWWIAEVKLGRTSHSVVFHRAEFRHDPAPQPREWSLSDVQSVVAPFCIASIFDREDGPPDSQP